MGKEALDSLTVANPTNRHSNSAERRTPSFYENAGLEPIRYGEAGILGSNFSHVNIHPWVLRQTKVSGGVFGSADTDSAVRSDIMHLTSERTIATSIKLLAKRPIIALFYILKKQKFGKYMMYAFLQTFSPKHFTFAIFEKQHHTFR